MKPFDDGMAVSRASSRVKVLEAWTEGEVLTPHGIVVVYAQGDATYSHHTRLDFVRNGRLYIRNFHGKRYSPRGLVTIAAKFAEEISTASPHGGKP